MRAFTTAQLAGLLAVHEAPCVSIYLPTQRSYPADQQDPLRYKNLLGGAEEALRRKYPGREVRSLMEKFHALGDAHFWTHRLDGLAVLGSPDTFQTFDLRRPVPERAVVGETFHVKPLLRIVQSADRYQILCLARSRVRLFEGNRDALDEVELRDVPRTIVEALGGEVAAHRRVVAGHATSSGGSHPAPGEPSGPHGHAAKGDEAKLEAERFFRVVDRAVWEHHSRPSGLPLLLAALPEHQAIFRAVSHNQHLMAEGIEQHPDSLSAEALREAAWQRVGPRYQQRLDKLTDDFRVAWSRLLGSDDLAQVAAAAHAGRVGTLLLDADRQVPGTLDGTTGTIRPVGDRTDANDLLDDLGELVLKRKGTVVVVPGDRMPTATGVAAVYRY